MEDVLLGAVIALVGQWFIAPIVERRQRAQERWEQQMLELGQLVTEQLPPAREAAYSAWLSWKYLHKVAAEKGWPASDDRLLAEDRRLRDAAQAAYEHWRYLADTRVGWLVACLRARDNDQRLWVAETMYSTTAIVLGPTIIWEPEGIEKLDEQWAMEQEYGKRLRDHVQGLTEQIAWRRRGWLSRKGHSIRARLRKLLRRASRAKA